MELNTIKDWYANRTNKTVSDFDEVDLFVCKVAYDFVVEEVKKCSVLDDVNGSTLVEILKAQTDFKLAIEIQNHVAENVFTYIINEHGVKLTYEEWRKTVKTYYR